MADSTAKKDALAFGRMYDLTPSISSYLDIHLVNALLDHLIGIGLHDKTQIIKQKIKIISQTNMTELVEDEYQKCTDDTEMMAEFKGKKNELEARRDAIFHRIDNEPDAVKIIDHFFKNVDLVTELKANANLTIDHLAQNYDINSDMLEVYCKFGKFKYDCGIYDEAEQMLGNYLSISQPHNPNVLGALWGRLSCRILQANWTESLQDLLAVKAAIESRTIAPADQLRQRAWLMHWAIFVYINQREGPDELVDLFHEKVYMQAIENLCPWLLRYYTVAAIMSKRRRNMLPEIVSELQNMHYMYSDPITAFLEGLYDSFDFDEASQRLCSCEQLLKNDFFLMSFTAKFLEEARSLIAELYCRINRTVDLRLLSDKLEMSEEDAERWMVDMVRGSTVGSNLDAKVDSSGKQVMMPAPVNTSHQQVMERTRDLSERTTLLTNNLSAMVHDQKSYLQLRKGIDVSRGPQ